VPLDLGYGGKSPVIHAQYDTVRSEGMPTQLPPSCRKRSGGAFHRSGELG
jgi:hypothetical protein